MNAHARMHTTTRHEAATALCRNLSAAVLAVVPPGLLHDPDAWACVTAASNEFLDALNDWKRDGDPARVPHVQHLYDEVVAAWAMAASEYMAASTPCERKVAP